MKRQIALLLVGLFIGVLLFGAPAIAQKQTLERRVRALETRLANLDARMGIRGPWYFVCPDTQPVFEIISEGFLCKQLPHGAPPN